MFADVGKVLLKYVDKILRDDFRCICFKNDRCALAAGNSVAKNLVDVGGVPGRTDHTPSKRRSNSVGVRGFNRKDDILWLVYVADIITKKKADINVLKWHKFVCDALEVGEFIADTRGWNMRSIVRELRS